MTSLPERPRRRAVSDQEARSILRRGLMERYRADARYQAIVKQDLTPLWKKVVAAPGWREEFPPSGFAFEDVLDELALLDLQDPEPLAAAHARDYVQAVARVVARSMGLMEEDRPSNWALRDLHEDVTGRSRHARLLNISPRIEDDDFSLSLDLTPNYVAVRYYPDRADPSARSDQEYDLSAMGVGYGPEHWAELERTACGIIREAITMMRDDIEGRHPLRNPTYIAKWDADLDALHRALFHKDRPLNPADSARLRRLADQLGIEPPGRRSDRAAMITESRLPAGYASESLQ